MIITTFQICLDKNLQIVASPVTATEALASFTKKTEAIIAAFLLIVLSLIIGYILKPVAMSVAGKITKCLFKYHAKTKNIPAEDMEFPFNPYFRSMQINPAEKEYKLNVYDEVTIDLRSKLRFSISDLPGHQPFGTAKRYLRLVAPTLWEESERMEAEVRMTGVIFLASLYSSLLSLSVLILQVIKIIEKPGKTNTFSWLLLSLLATYILAEGYNRARIREVGYTYVNTLIALNCSQSVATSGANVTKAESDAD